MLTLPGFPGFPSTTAPVVDSSGRMTRVWYAYFQSVDAILRKLSGPLPSYTVATLPNVVAGELIYVSDGTGNKRLAVGDGTNWRFPDGNIVS